MFMNSLVIVFVYVIKGKFNTKFNAGETFKSFGSSSVRGYIVFFHNDKSRVRICSSFSGKDFDVLIKYLQKDI